MEEASGSPAALDSLRGGQEHFRTPWAAGTRYGGRLDERRENVEKLQTRISTQTAPRVVTVAGEIDMTTQSLFAAAVAEGLTGADALVLDLLGVEFADSTGLWALLKAQRDAAARGVPLRIAASRPVMRLVELAQVQRVLLVHHDRATAINACG
jgi:anti-sigma B factor antagonist